jgi:L-fuconolactonase
MNLPAKEFEMLPIIDTHQHMWDRNVFNLSWVEGAGHLDADYLMSDYLEATRDLNVVKTVYMEVDVDPQQQLKEAEYVTELSKSPDNPMAAAVVSGRPTAEGFAAYVRGFADNPCIKGIRQVLHTFETPPRTCLEPAYVQGVRLLGEQGLSFDICIRPSELGDAVQLVDQCPDTRFILDHCGNADPLVVSGAKESEPGDPYEHGREQWQRDMEELGKRKNAVCKVSGIVARVPEQWSAQDLAPTVDHCLDCLRPRPRRLWRRLAGLHPGSPFKRLGHCPAGNHRRPQSGRAEQTATRQRCADLRSGLRACYRACFKIPDEP